MFLNLLVNQIEIAFNQKCDIQLKIVHSRPFYRVGTPVGVVHKQSLTDHWLCSNMFDKSTTYYYTCKQFVCNIMVTFAACQPPANLSLL